MKENKVDKGFELLYKNLSYRRKFIRTIWMIIPGVLVGILISCICNNIIVPLIYWIMFLTVGIIQLIYNYTMWKKEINKK